MRRIERGTLAIVLLWLALLPLSTPRIYATDEVQYYAYLRSVYFDGDLDFRNEYTYFAEQGRKNGDTAIFDALLRDKPDDPPVSPKTGLLRNVAPVGSAIMWAPGFALADLGVILARAFGSRVLRDGFSWPYVWGACYASAAYALGGLLLTYRLLRRYVTQYPAALAVIGCWLATPLVFYSTIVMPWSHATGFFLFALLLVLLVRPSGRLRQAQPPRVSSSEHSERAPERAAASTGSATASGAPASRSERPPASRSERPPASVPPRAQRASPILLGLVAGLMTLTREQLALLLIVPAVLALAELWALARRRAWRQAGGLAIGGGLALAVFALTLVPQFVAYQILYGQPRPSTVVSGKLKLCSPHMFDTLVDFSPTGDFHQAACGQIAQSVFTALGRPFDLDGWAEPAGSNRLNLKPLSHGALLWSPILALGLIGLGWLWRRDRVLTIALVLGVLAQCYVNGAISTWHLTRSFGFRRLIECIPIFALGVALLLEALVRRTGRWPALVLVGLLVYWNFGLIAQFTFARTELRNGLIWQDMLRYQFVEVPRQALSKVETLLFNRCRLVKNC